MTLELSREPEFELLQSVWEIEGLFSTKSTQAVELSSEDHACFVDITDDMLPKDLLFDQEHLLDFDIVH